MRLKKKVTENLLITGKEQKIQKQALDSKCRIFQTDKLYCSLLSGVDIYRRITNWQVLLISIKSLSTGLNTCQARSYLEIISL